MPVFGLGDLLVQVNSRPLRVGDLVGTVVPQDSNGGGLSFWGLAGAPLGKPGNLGNNPTENLSRDGNG